MPWAEAFSGAPFPDDFQKEVVGKAGVSPRGHVRYLAVSTLNKARDGLAEAPGGRLPAPWSGYVLDHPDVIEAYGRYVERMIELYEPDYLAYVIEANMFADNHAERWDELVALSEATYRRVKAAHPALPVFVTLQAEWVHRAPAAQAAAIERLLPFTDVIAVSSYPFIDAPNAADGGAPVANVESLDGRYFREIAELAADKPFAITETGWPAEDVDAPYPVVLPGSPEAQRAYVERLIAEAEALDALFVVWFFTRDFDAQWEQVISTLAIAPTARIWRDNGLYDGDGVARPALVRWREALDVPLR